MYEVMYEVARLTLFGLGVALGVWTLLSGRARIGSAEVESRWWATAFAAIQLPESIALPVRARVATGASSIALLLSAALLSPPAVASAHQGGSGYPVSYAPGADLVGTEGWLHPDAMQTFVYDVQIKTVGYVDSRESTKVRPFTDNDSEWVPFDYFEGEWVTKFSPTPPAILALLRAKGLDEALGPATTPTDTVLDGAAPDARERRSSIC